MAQSSLEFSKKTVATVYLKEIEEMKRADRRHKKKKSKKKRGSNIVAKGDDLQLQTTLSQGVSFHQSGRIDEAIASYKKVLELQPDNTIALSNLSFALQMQGKLDEAVICCQKAISIQPNYIDAHFNLGNILKAQGRIDMAIASYKQAIAIKPDYIEALYNLGIILQEQRRFDESIAVYQHVCSINPNFAEVYNCIGSIFQEQQKLDQAVANYQRAISIKPDYVEALSNLGFIMTELGQFDEAANFINKAISLNPKFAVAHNNLGYLMEEQARLDEATTSYQRAIDIQPDYIEAISNLASVFEEQGKLAESVLLLQRVLAINPNYAIAHNSLGSIANKKGRLNEAVDYYKRAVLLDDKYASAYNNLGLVQLLLGDYKNGWRNFSWRWELDQYDVDRYSFHKEKLWQGEPLAGKRILVWGEQGVGENLLFASVVKDLIKIGDDIVLECNERLLKLFLRSFPSITVIPHPEKLEIEKHDLEYDYIVPFGNICQWLRPDINSFSPTPYHLIADENLKQVFRKRYLKESNNLLVGLSWMSKSTGYKNKSMTLMDLLPLLEIEGITFVNLQYGDTSEERRLFFEKTKINIIDDPEVDQMGEMDSFAAQVAAMDVVVTISNTTTHMAGALGVPTLVMLGVLPIWYWMLDKKDCVWYSSLTLYRQQEIGVWQDVVVEVTKEITTNFLPLISETKSSDETTLNKIQSILAKGVELHNSGSIDGAIKCYEEVLEIQPENIVALSNLGLAFQVQGRLDKAISSCEKAIAINPKYVDVHYNLGNILRVAGKIDGAISSYKKAISIKKDFAKAHFNLAVSLQEQGKFDEAIISYKDAIAISKHDVAAYNNLGIIYQEQGKLDSAVAIYQQALKIQPDYVEAHYNLGLTLHKEGKFDLAVESYKKAIAINEDYAEAHYNLGVTLQEQGRLNQAVESYQQAITIKPDYAKAYNNLGIITLEQGQLDSAIAIYKKGIAIKPDYADTYNNLSLVQLLKCDFKQGWSNYVWRWKTDQYDSHRYYIHKKNLWRGEPVANKRIYIWAEQGVGESIIFSRMLTDLIDDGASIVLECNHSLIKLFARSYPTITCISPAKEVSLEDLEKNFDYIVPFGNLCSWLRPDLDSYPQNPSLLVADGDHTTKLRNSYRQSPEDILVGIAWYSNSLKYKNKSISLLNLRPLFDIEGVTFVNLQYGDTRKEREELKKSGDITFVHDDSIDQMENLDSFAAQVAAMDLVVTISNTTAHISGALGVPTLLMLGEVPIWYWMLNRTDSPWYPSLTLFRQKKQGDWGDVVNAVGREIKSRIAKNS
ncbi:MAG: tetratricopeptide repeat protein [Magnetococcales bacterium]|nr:tetratricopeptide repeat protein [Magnetococcales bacterium]